MNPSTTPTARVLRFSQMGPATVLIQRAAALLMLTVGFAVGSARAQSDAAPAFAERGIINFHNSPFAAEEAGGLNDPAVVGNELFLTWREVEPQPGVYKWEAIEHTLDLWLSRGKFTDIRISSAHNDPDETPSWLFYDDQVRRIAFAIWSSFEEGSEPYQLEPGAERTNDPALVVNRAWSVAAQDAQSPAGDPARPVLSIGTDTATGPVQRPTFEYAPVIEAPRVRPRDGYSLQFDYLTPQDTRVWVRVESPSGGAAAHQEFAFESPAGARGFRSQRLQLGPWPDQRIVIGYDAPGALALDNVSVMPLRSQLSTFDPPAPGVPVVTSTVQTERGPLTAVDDFILLPGAALREAAGAGYVELTNSTAEYQPLLWSNPAEQPLKARGGHRVALDLTGVDTSEVVWRVLTRDAAGAERVQMERHFALAPGQHHEEILTFGLPPGTQTARLEVGLSGPGRVNLAQTVWNRLSERSPGFPNYFDPRFNERWARMVTAFATRFGNHPGLRTVSVGGLGRWEEVILEDDYYGRLNDQWLSMGYSDAVYLRHIEQQLDLYKRLLPNKRLRLCLAYGLNNASDTDVIYRRAAQAAVARGIEIKQNGMSERYDSWGVNTNTSYLYNHYRDQPGVTTLYETGGQIFNNGMDAHGYPVSLLNRVLIDGTDFLYLYPVDITSRHIGKYFPYFHAMQGRPVLTTFYNRLGDYRLRNEHRSEPVLYHNQWLGLRQAFDHGAPKERWTEIDGQRCGVTTAEWPVLVFDIDDRQQHRGLWGTWFAIDYLDRGRDQLSVGFQNQVTQSWDHLTTLTKTGSDAWRTVRIYHTGWAQSARQSGTDVHHDLVIDAINDGPEYVRSVELHGVPAREWARVQRTPAIAVESLAGTSASAQLLSTTRTLEVDVPAGRPLAMVGVPLWADVTRTGRAGLRVLGQRAGSAEWTWLGDKHLDLPAAGEWLDVPIIPDAALKRLRLVVYAREHGEALGWLRGGDGTPLWRGESLEPAAGPAPAADGTLLTAWPLAAYQGATLPATVEREMAPGEWVAVAALTHATPDGEAWFEPQTPGRYRLLDARGQMQQAAALVLRRAQPPWPAEAAPANQPPAREFATFTTRTEGDASEWPVDLPAVANAVLELTLRNEGPLPQLRVLWSDTPGSFSLRDSVLVPIPTHDGPARRITYPLGYEAGWRGHLRALRIEPVGAASTAGLNIDGMRLLQPTVLAHWDFADATPAVKPVPGTSPAYWNPRRDITLTQAGGALTAAISGPSAQMVTFGSPANFDAAEGQVLRLRARNATAATRARLRWQPITQAGHGNMEWLSSGPTIEWDLRPHDAQMHEYLIDLGSNPAWRGQVIALAIEPASGAATGELVIDDLSIEQRD